MTKTVNTARFLFCRICGNWVHADEWNRRDRRCWDCCHANPRRWG